MAASSARFEITVRDNGGGFDVAAAEHVAAAGAGDRTRRGGNGLWNMRQRLADVGGQFAITSQAGEGTTVTLSVSLGVESPLRL